MKALGLFSGGLDSALAVRLLKEQNIEVTALNFSSPFCTCTGEGCSKADLAKSLDVPIKIIPKGQDYIDLIRHPKYGYGKGLNPCIDCKIYILKKAREYASEIGASFIFTGDVLGQRPMSQHLKTIKLIEQEAGLENQVLRPLSAAHFEPTVPEQKGWVDRSKLLGIQGRSRKTQIDIARQYEMEGFMCGGPGCRLTDKQYAKRLKAWFDNSKELSLNDILVTMNGRHFMQYGAKIIVGRNEQENNRLQSLMKPGDIQMEAENYVGPLTIIRHMESYADIELAAMITARYSDAPKGDVNIRYIQNGAACIIHTTKRNDVQIQSYMLA